MTVRMTGVRVRSQTVERRPGRRPSRHIEYAIRVWPYSIVSTTLEIATSAPKDTMSAPQPIPAPSESAVLSGAASPARSLAGSAPTAAIATKM